VVSIKVSDRNGNVVGAVQVVDGQEIMLISDQGTLVRTRVDEVSTVGRNTQGVRLIRTAEAERVVALQRIDEIEAVEMVEDADQDEAVEANLETSDSGNNDTSEENGENSTPE
jgi:DNA gyrase subunit A